MMISMMHNTVTRLSLTVCKNSQNSTSFLWNQHIACAMLKHMQREYIEQKLGYRFKNEYLLHDALSHPSLQRDVSSPSPYERLEYLGDAVLELVVSVRLFAAYPDADEGVLTKMRASIVSRKHLGDLAKKLGWGEQLLMNSYLEKSGGRNTRSVLANTFESIIGAVMLDSDFATASQVALRLLGEHWLEEARALFSTNPKGELQELLQSINNTTAEYQVDQITQFPPLYRAVAVWQNRVLGTGEGSSKRRAETAAAEQALLHLKSENSA